MHNLADVSENTTVLKWYQLFMGCKTETYIRVMTSLYSNAKIAWQAIEALAED